MNYDKNDYTPVSNRIVGESESGKAWETIDQDLETVFIPKSVSRDDGVGGLEVQNWFIEQEGLG